MATTTHQAGDGGDGMEARIARLESDVAHLSTDVAEIKIDLRDLRKEMRDEFKAFRSEVGEGFKSFRDEFRILWGALFFITLGLSGMIAKGFGWL